MRGLSRVLRNSNARRVRGGNASSGAYVVPTANMFAYRGAWNVNWGGTIPGYEFGRGATGYTISGTNYLLSTMLGYGVYEHPIGTPVIPASNPYSSSSYGTPVTATKVYDQQPNIDASARRVIGDNDLGGDNGLGWDSVNGRLILTYSEGYGSGLGCAAYATVNRAAETAVGKGRFTLSNPTGFKAYSTGALVVPQDYADAYLGGNRIALIGGRNQSINSQQDVTQGLALTSIGDYTIADGVGQQWSDLATSGAGSTTLTSATGGFTAGMIGKRVLIYSGTNFAAGGTYVITGYTNGNTVTVNTSPTPGGAGSGGAGWLAAVVDSVPLVGYWPTTNAPGAGYGRMGRPDGGSLIQQTVDSWGLDKHTWTDHVEGADWIDTIINGTRYQGVLFVGRSSVDYVGYVQGDVVKGGHRPMWGCFDPADFAPSSANEPHEVQPDWLTWLTIPSVNDALYAPGADKAVTSITSDSGKSHGSADGCTVTCTGHGLSAGNTIGIKGSGASEYNAAWRVESAPNANTLLISNTSIPGNWSGTSSNNAGITLALLGGDGQRVMGCKFFSNTNMLYVVHQMNNNVGGPDSQQVMVSAWELEP